MGFAWDMQIIRIPRTTIIWKKMEHGYTYPF